MSQSTRLAKSTSDELPADLVELVSQALKLPEDSRAPLQQALNRVVESTKRRRRILTLVQDALGQLRLDMKYMMFDLEATRRERDEYRRQVEGK
ncbi:MAG TPA: transcriptional regulator [Pirellulales bacterium]|nr:transcriptional regulator [Pirellulales bacterium]